MQDLNVQQMNVAQEMLDILFEVAPDRAEDLATVFRERGVHVKPVDEQHITPLLSIPDTGEIRAYMPVLKCQMVMALAYVMAYRSASQENTSVKKVRLSDSPCGEDARKMLQWAMYERYLVARSVNTGEEPPNERIPHSHWLPLSYAPQGSDDVIAVRMFYTALAADMYHEVAHIAKRHRTQDTAEAVRQEEEADEEAARFLVGDRTEEHAQFTGRMLGLVLSQTYDVFFTLEGFKNDPLHPPIVSRLRKAVAGRVKNPDHAVWAFIAAILTLHLEIRNKTRLYDNSLEHHSFRAMAEYLMQVYEGQ